MKTKYVVKEKKGIALLGMSCIMIGGMVLILLLTMKSKGVEAGILMSGAFLVCGIAILVEYYRRRLVVKEGYYSYTPFIGSTKEFSIYDIGHLYLSFEWGEVKILLTAKTGERLCKLEMNMENVKQFMEELQERGMELEVKQ